MNNTKIVSTDLTQKIIQKINPLFEKTILKDIFNEQAIAVMKTILILFIIKIHKANKEISIEKVSDLLIAFNKDLQAGGVFGNTNTKNKKSNPISFTHMFKVMVLTLTLFCLLFLDYSYIVELEKRTYTEQNMIESKQNDSESSSQIVPYAQTTMIPIEQIKQEINELNKNHPKDKISNILDLIEDISEEINKNIKNLERNTKSITQNAVMGVTNIAIISVMSKMISVDGKQLVISKMLTEKTNTIIQKYGEIANIQLKGIQNDFKIEFKNFKDLIEKLNDPSFIQRFNNFIQFGLSYATNPESIKNQISIEMHKIFNILKKLNNIKTIMGLGFEEIESDATLEINKYMNELLNHVNNIYYLFGTTFTIFGALLYELTPSNEGQNVIINVQMPNGYMPNGYMSNGNEHNGEERKYEYEYENDNQNSILYKPTGADVEDELVVPVTRRSVTRSKQSKPPKQIGYNPIGGKSKKSRKNKKSNKTNKKRIVKKNKTYKK